MASKPPALEENGRTDSPSQPSEGSNPVDILISDFWPLECEAINFCYLSHPLLGAL